MRLQKFYTPLILLTAFLIIPEISNAQNNEVTVRDAGWGKLDIAGFNLSTSAKIKIEGTGVSYNRHRTGEIAYGWILNSDNRRVVWSLLNNDDFDHRGKIENFYLTRISDFLIPFPNAFSICRMHVTIASSS